jgi:endonuclease/exonuclease/phosphatase family metal-dependent hydrolase
VDYVLVRPADLWRVIESSVVDAPVASDHRPVLAVLEWTGDR